MENLLLTVVMPVFNGQKYLREAIDSVLDQTFENFEFLIIDDGSTDDSVLIISTYKDPRIRLIENEINKGVAFIRNIGLNEAKGKYLAWLDCDDLIDPYKFQKQVLFLEENPTIGICGTWLERFNDGARKLSTTFINPELIKAALFFKPAVLNATTMFRMSMIKKENLFFDTRLKVAEDYDFFLRSSYYFKIYNLPEKLYYYRASESSIMKKFENKEDKMNEFYSIIYEKAFEMLNIIPSIEKFALHRKIGSTQIFYDFTEMQNALNWLIFLKKQNSNVQLYNQDSFLLVLGNMFYFLCKKSSVIGLKTFNFYLSNKIEFGIMEGDSVFKLFIRCLIRYNKF